MRLPPAIDPLSALPDSRNAQIVSDLLASLHEHGNTFVMISPDPRRAERAEHRIALFDREIVDDRRIGIPAVVGSGPPVSSL